MHPDLATALRLQAIDLHIASLKREISLLPKQIAEIETALESHTRRLELDKAAYAANQRERKKLEADAQVSEQKISKLRDQMLQAKTNEQYRAFQHEIGFCEAAIRKAEDQILELMGEAEKLEKNVKSAEAALAQERKEVEAEKAKAKARTEEDKAALAEDEKERAAAAASLEKSTLAAYEKIRSRYKDGVAIAEAKDGLCTACNLAIRPQHYQDVRLGEQVSFCENCKRILYFEQVQDIEGAMNV
jgi:uncharacterized protein